MEEIWDRAKSFMKLKVSLVMGNKKVIVKKTAILMIFAAGLVLALFFAEIMVRKFVNFPIKKEYGKFLHLAGFSIPKASFNESLFWMQGEQFRGGKHTKEKKQGFFRIICLGDSVTQGHGPYSKQEGVVSTSCSPPLVIGG